MKKNLLILFLAVYSIYFGISPDALKAEPRTGVQFGSSSNITIIHYGDNFSYAFGGSIGLGHDDNPENTEEVEIGIFARKNFKVEEKTYLGFGLNGGFNFGEREGKKIKSSFYVAPYFIIDYHLNKNFIVNGGANIVNLEQEKIGGAARVTSFSYFDPFLAVTYLF